MGLPKKTEKTGGASAICDGRELFDAAQACSFLRCSPELLRQATLRGALTPARVGKGCVYTRRDLERYRRHFREAGIVAKLVEGAHPLDLYLENPGRYPLKEVTRVMHDWAKLSGIWIVEGPRGSFARWLQRFELVRCSPRELRRMIEALLRDPELGARVRLYFEEQRGRSPASHQRTPAEDFEQLEGLEVPELD
jgi:hypothetical protein